MSEIKSQSVELSTGSRMPVVGLGTWKIPKDRCADIVESAIKQGYRAIDCACDYGNEKEVGVGIANAIKKGYVTRKDLFVTSKLWNTYHAKEHVLPALKRTLSDLGLDYLDLFMIHFPIALKFVPFETRYPPEWQEPSRAGTDEWNGQEFANVPYRETYEAMEATVKQGLVKNLGVCNLQFQLLMDLLSYCKIRPQVHQFEAHPYLQQTRLVNYSQKQGIQCTAFSSLGALSYHVFMGQEGAEKAPNLLKEQKVADIAAKHKKTPAQVLLRWSIERKFTIIPKTSNPDRLAENLALFDFALDAEDMQVLAKLERNLRFNDSFCAGPGLMN